MRMRALVSATFFFGGMFVGCMAVAILAFLLPSDPFVPSVIVRPCEVGESFDPVMIIIDGVPTKLMCNTSMRIYGKAVNDE
jgi:hypothetical protein